MIIIQRIFPLFFYIYKGKCYLSEGELTEVLYEEQNVIRSELQLFSNSKEKVDTCMNYTRPPLAITIEPIRGAFVDAKKRDVKLRYLTEITKDNVSYCKELIPLVDEMRHLDGIKGNFMISELEYLAPIILFEKGKIASQIIYSNQKEIVEQHQYMFDTLWNKAISAQQRIKEIEGGVIGQEHYQTRFLENPNEVSEELKKITDTSEDDSWSICSTFDGLLMITCNKDFEKMQGRLVDSSRRGKNTRWVGTINKNNIDLVKAYLDLGMKIRHIDNMPPMNFAISSKELYITIDEMKGGQIAKNLLISNEPPYIRHYISIFEDLWNKSVPAEEKIREIKEGVVIGKTEVIQNPQDIQQLFINMVKSAKHEILLLLPTINAFYRKERIGIIELLKQASKREDNRVNVRILTPTKDTIEEKLQNMVAASERRDTKRENGGEEEQQIKTKKKSFDIRHIDVESTKEANAEVFAEVARKSAAVTTVTIVVVDRKESLVIEKKDDSKHNFIEAVGTATYSNSKPTVLSYVSIFENLWRQSELYQQLKESNKQLEQANDQLEKQDKIQKEFINIAAHELRTPIQPILGLTQMIYSNIDKDGSSPYEKRKQKEMLEVVIRNANRLQRLSEDILDVTRIESQNLNLKLERLNLDKIISNAINDAKRSHQIKDNVSLLYQRDKYDNNDSVFIQADRGRLNQVISNLISNAIKFTKEGSIIVNAKKEERENKVIVSLKDSGIGIDPEVLPRLFQKFATKSYQGTGLGLYISKSIVEAHGGRMWAENNSGGKGAVFYFTLPIIDRKEEKRK